MAILELVRAVYGSPLRGIVFGITLAGAVLFALWLFPAASRKSGSPDNKIVDLQRAYTVERFGAVLLAWSASNPGAVGIMKRDNLRRLDFIFPLLYGIALALAYAIITGRRQPTPLDVVLFMVPLVAALFDYAENTVHLGLLTGIETRDDVLRAIDEQRFHASTVFLASLCAHAKFVLLAVSGAGLLFGIVERIRS